MGVQVQQAVQLLNNIIMHNEFNINHVLHDEYIGLFNKYGYI